VAEIALAQMAVGSDDDFCNGLTALIDGLPASLDGWIESRVNLGRF
jgi:hypothetical protein